MKFNNKRILSLLLIFILTLSFIGCANEEPVEETSMEVAEEEVVDEVTEDPADQEEVSLEEEVNGYFAEMPEHIYKIGQADFVEMVKAGEEMTIIDIRQPDAYAEGHIEGAANLPWGPAISENLSKIPKDQPVFIYCYSGQTAGQAVHTLNVAGFDARSVNLGWNFGISKVEGVDAVVSTEAVELSGDTTIAPAVQSALDAYYNGLADVSDTKYKNYKISEDNLKEMVDNKEDFYLLSIRQEEAYNEGHIEGAELIPWGKGMQESFDTLPMDKKIVVYCYSGQTAGQTVAGLRLLGYDAVSLNGGMGVGANAPLGWSNKDYPVVQGNIVADQVNAYFAEMPEHIYKIGQADFVEMVKAGEEMTIIDIRQPDAYAEGHIEGAANLPWGPAISENLSKISKDQPVFIYCYSGQTAGQAVHTLNVAGFDARSVNLGWNFGISKVEGVDAVVSTEAVELSGNTTIALAVQSALDAYYNGLADVSDTKYKNYKISEDNLKEMVDNQEDFYLLSIRQEEAYNEGHIEGAELIPWGKGMEESFDTLPMDKKIVVYCYSGQTAGQTVAGLRLLGYDAVSLNGGMGVDANAPLGWSNKNYPVVQ